MYGGTKVARVETLCDAEAAVVGEIGQDADMIAATPDTAREKQELLWEMVENAGEDLSSQQRSSTTSC